MAQAASTNHRSRSIECRHGSGGSSWRNFDDDLINVVKNYRVLYDVTLKEFKNNATKDNAWKAVADELGAQGNINFLV